jgi:hypothetical protein
VVAADPKPLAGILRADPSRWLFSSRSDRAQHEPLTVMDAPQRTTTYTATEQIETVTNAKSEATTYIYNTTDHLTGMTRQAQPWRTTDHSPGRPDVLPLPPTASFPVLVCFRTRVYTPIATNSVLYRGV